MSKQQQTLNYKEVVMATQEQIFNNYFGTNTKAKNVTEIVNTPVLPVTIPNTTSQRAEGNTDMFGFAEAVHNLLNEAWEDDWGTFTINGSNKDGNVDTMKLPMIVFDIVERTPSRNKVGLKSRVMEMQIDPDNDDYSIILHRKWFDSVVEFLVLDATNQDAIKLADRFELFIDTFTGFFKEAGISELIFLKEVDSRLSKNYIEGIPSRCLRYQMVIERIVVERVRTTKDVRSKIQATSLNRG